MTQSRVFWKILASATLILAIGALVIVISLSWSYQKRLDDQAQHRLHDFTVLMQQWLTDRSERIGDQVGSENNFDLAGLQARVHELSGSTDMRVTIIDPDGKVLVDSHEDPAVMENHKNRPELVTAMRTGTGFARHRSPTLNVDMLYSAAAIKVDGRVVAAVRVAMPASDVSSSAQELTRRTMLAATVILVLLLSALTFAIFVILRPIPQLMQTAGELVQGNYQQELTIDREDEFGHLANVLNELGRTLDDRMEQGQRRGDQLATVLGSMDEGVVATDDQQRILFANQAAGRMLEFDNRDFTGRPLWEVVRHPGLEKTVELAQHVERPQLTELEIGGKDPRRRVGLHVTRLPGKPSPGLVLVFHDVTELRRLEKVRQDFVANVSHELKTPLASIKGYAETLLAGALNDPEANQRFVERIEIAATRLEQLIHDLISLARIESGEQPFEITAVPLDDRIREWTMLHADSANAKGITLQIEPADEPLSVKADEEGIRQIVDNLLDNAIKYTPDGGKVTVRWSRDNSKARLEVCDNGIGIPQSEQQRIFERFFRVDRARSRQLGGTGLGLSIVKHLVQSFEGSVGVESRPGKGSRFYVLLPLG